VSEKPPTGNLFNNLHVFGNASSSTVKSMIDEIACYLHTGPEKVENHDLLMWWYERKHIYPHLYHMALDYLSIPCTL
jgi:hypothetical protein